MSRYLQGRFIPNNPQKYAGDVTQIFYRSSWELKFLRWCDHNPDVIQYSSEEIVIPYLCPTDNRVHRYFPDAKITVRDRDGNVKTYIVEIKPEKQTKPPTTPKRKTKQYINEVLTWGKNEAKWKACENYCADRGYTFMIITEKHLGLK